MTGTENVKNLQKEVATPRNNEIVKRKKKENTKVGHTCLGKVQYSDREETGVNNFLGRSLWYDERMDQRNLPS